MTLLATIGTVIGVILAAVWWGIGSKIGIELYYMFIQKKMRNERKNWLEKHKPKVKQTAKEIFTLDHFIEKEDKKKKEE